MVHLSPGLLFRLILLFASALGFGCADTTPKFIDVVPLQNAADSVGPFLISATVAGGEGRRSVWLLAGGATADLDSNCAEDLQRGPWRGLDGGISFEADGCFKQPLKPVGPSAEGRFEGRFRGPPFLPNALLRYRLVVEDEDGDEGRWPIDGAAEFVIQPDGVPLALLGTAPSEGPASGGQLVLLRGEGFSAQTVVQFGGVLARTTFISAHLLEAIAPAGHGPVELRVTRAGRTVVAERPFTYYEPPDLTRVDPAEGWAVSETLVVLEGSFTSGTDLFVDGAPVESEWIDPTRILATLPAGEPGWAPLRLVDRAGQSQGYDQIFRRWPAPTIDQFTPAVGPDAGGGIVTLRGARLRAPGAAYFGEIAAPSVSVEPNGEAATIAIPPHLQGTVPIRWYNPDGQWAVVDPGYRFVGAPALDSAEPPELSRCGGGLTTLVGRNLTPDMQVLINGQPAEVIEVSGDGQRALIRAPAGDPGPARVEVIAVDGRRARRDTLVFYGVQPVVNGVSVRRVPVWGGVEVEVEGADFSPGLRVLVDDRPAERVDLVRGGCEARLTLVVPPHEAGVVDLRVIGEDDRVGLLPDAFEYVSPRLEPPAGLTPGYTNARLLGVDLRPGLRVRIAGRPPRSLQRVSDTEWRLVTGAGPLGAAVLDVRNADGRGAALDDGFRFRQFFDETAENLNPGGDCNDLSIADVDADGDTDLVLANGALGGLGRVQQPVELHLNDGSGAFQRRAIGVAGNGMNVNFGDIDGDSDPDLVVANLSGNTPNQLLINDGRGGFEVRADFVGRRWSSYDADFLDADGDGDLDLFLLQNGSPGNNVNDGPDRLLLNDGRGRFSDRSEAVDFALTDVHDHDFGHGDLNGDGLPEIIIVVDNLSDSFDLAENRLLINRGEGRFERADSPFNDFRGDWLHAEVVDIDGDGDLDVLLPQDYLEGFSRPDTPALAVFRNDGQGGFEHASDVVVDLPRVPAFETVTRDVDGDGDVDILVAVFGILYGDGSIEAFRSRLLLNDGGGLFHDATGAFATEAIIASTDFAVADLDGDGATDLVECAARGESRLWIQR